MKPVRRYECPRGCGRKATVRSEACCAQCHWHRLDPAEYPAAHSRLCDHDARTATPLPPLPAEVLVAALVPRPKGLRIRDCQRCFPGPLPAYVRVQALMRKLERGQMVVRVGRGRYTLTPRYRLFLWERRGVVLPGARRRSVDDGQ